MRTRPQVAVVDCQRQRDRFAGLLECWSERADELKRFAALIDEGELGTFAGFDLFSHENLGEWQIVRVGDPDAA